MGGWVGGWVGEWITCSLAACAVASLHERERSLPSLTPPRISRRSLSRWVVGWVGESFFFPLSSWRMSSVVCLALCVGKRWVGGWVGGGWVGGWVGGSWALPEQVGAVDGVEEGRAVLLLLFFHPCFST